MSHLHIVKHFLVLYYYFFFFRRSKKDFDNIKLVFLEESKGFFHLNQFFYRYFFDNDEYQEIYARYMGVPSPICSAYVGMPIKPGSAERMDQYRTAPLDLSRVSRRGAAPGLGNAAARGRGQHAATQGPGSRTARCRGARQGGAAASIVSLAKANTDTQVGYSCSSIEYSVVASTAVA